MKKKLDKDAVESTLEYRYGLEAETTAECPYCHSPLLNDMTVCPKCYYDISTSDGGPEHKKWLEKPAYEEETSKAPKCSVKPEDVMITSLTTINGYNITKLGGMVFSDILIKLEEISALEIDDNDMSSLYSDVRHLIVQKLQKDAADMGANAIVNAVYSSAIEGTFFHMTLCGTAVHAQLSKERPKGVTGGMTGTAGAGGVGGAGGANGNKPILSTLIKILSKGKVSEPKPF